MKKNNHLTHILVSIGVVLLLVAIGIYLYLSYPRSPIAVEYSLISPPHQEVWGLFQTHASTDQIIDAILATGVHVDDIQWMGSSVLSFATSKDRPEIVAWLLEQGADPNGTEPSSAPLRFTVDNHDTEIAELLLEYGADPDMDVGGMTVRWIINQSGSEELKTLLANWPKDKQEINKSKKQVILDSNEAEKKELVH